MTETINLAPAVLAAVHGHAVPIDLCALAALSAGGVLIALGLDWARQLGATTCWGIFIKN